MLFILTLSAVPSYHLPKTTQFNEQCHKYFAQLEYPRKEGSASLDYLRVYIILNVVYIHMCYWLSVGSRRLNIGQVLLYDFFRRGQ